jgi:hypothetical protein
MKLYRAAMPAFIVFGLLGCDTPGLIALGLLFVISCVALAFAR